MRTVLLDPNGSVLDESMLYFGTMIPVKNFIARTGSGEIVQVVQVDIDQQPQPVWNLAALG